MTGRGKAVGRRCRFLILAALLAVLPASGGAEPSRRLPPPAAATAGAPPGAAFSRSLSEAVLREALAALADRYIEPVALPDLAGAAARALAAADPGLAIQTGGGRGDWRLTLDGREIATHRMPEARDAAGWAHLLATFAAAAQVAPPVRHAGQAILATLLDGATAGLDPYTRYAPPREARAAEGRRRGEGGIGVRTAPAADGAAIIEVVPESPAYHAGLAEGDRIVSVDGTRLRGLSEERVASLLAGEEDTRLVLSVRPQRTGPVREVAIIRALVVAPSVHTERRGDVAILRVSTFNRLTDQHLSRALLDVQGQAGEKGLAGIVLDLRGNRGGLLRQAVAVVDLFLSTGEIVATRGRHPDAARTYVAGGADLAGDTPLLVLVDGATASAGEIVAASLQGQRRAVVVGSATMGKGRVQTVMRLPDGGELVLTWSRVIVPPGQELDGLGVLPTLCTARGPEVTARQLAELRRGELPERPAQQARDSCPPRDGGAADLDAAVALLADGGAVFAALGTKQPRPGRPQAARDHLAGAN